VRIGVPPVTIEKASGLYIWVTELAKRCSNDHLDAASLANVAYRSINKGSDFLPQKNGKKSKLRHHYEFYRKLGSTLVRRRTYAHEAEFRLILAQRQVPLQRKVGYLTKPESLKKSGLGYHNFKDFVICESNCKKLIGRVADSYFQKTGINLNNQEQMWLADDLVDVRKKLAELAVEYPDYSTEKDLRRKYPGLPTTPFKQFRAQCRFLPDDRGMQFHDDVLRQDRLGGYRYHTVWSDSDAAIMQREKKLPRKQRVYVNPVNGKRYLPLAELCELAGIKDKKTRWRMVTYLNIPNPDLGGIILHALRVDLKLFRSKHGDQCWVCSEEDGKKVRQFLNPGLALPPTGGARAIAAAPETLPAKRKRGRPKTTAPSEEMKDLRTAAAWEAAHKVKTPKKDFVKTAAYPSAEPLKSVSELDKILDRVAWRKKGTRDSE
jgi:hypothetical protein